MMKTVMNFGNRDFPVSPHAYNHQQFLENGLVVCDTKNLVRCKARFDVGTFGAIDSALSGRFGEGFNINCFYDDFREATFYLDTGSPESGFVITATNTGFCVTGKAEYLDEVTDAYDLVMKFYSPAHMVHDDKDSQGTGPAVGVEYWYCHKGELGSEQYQRTPDSGLIDELYEHIDPREMINAFYDAKDTILFMHGEPGVGKSYIVQYGIEYLSRTLKVFNPNAYEWRENKTPMIWYVKDLKVFGMDEFWSQLVAREPELVVLDDISSGIAPRNSGEEGNFVEKFLSISDGIFRIRTKFIFTTNLEKENIDQALLRPGRCFDYFNMKPLTGDYARRLMNKMLEKNGQEHADVFEGMSFVPQAVFTQTLDRLLRKPATYYRKDM